MSSPYIEYVPTLKVPLYAVKVKSCARISTRIEVKVGRITTNKFSITSLITELHPSEFSRQ